MPFKVGQFLVNPLNFLEYPNSMFLAVVEALKTETFPNPKVGAVLIDKNNKLKVYLKTEHIVKELNNCKKGVYQINNKEFTAIICKTNYGYEVIKWLSTLPRFSIAIKFK